VNIMDGSLIAVFFWGISSIVFLAGAAICFVSGAFCKGLAFIAGIAAWSYLSIASYLIFAVKVSSCAHNCTRGANEQNADIVFSLAYAIVTVLVIWNALRVLNNLEAGDDAGPSTGLSSDGSAGAPK
jgi:hypothetical protein